MKTQFIYNQHINRSVASRYPNSDDTEVGIEIELEGTRWPQELNKWWTPHADGSLREGIEYVLTSPVRRDQVRTAVDYLNTQLTKAGTRINLSYRCSVHIHINVHNFTWKQAYNLITLSYIFEDLLAEMGGSERMGNNFCLRAKDAEHAVQQLRKAIKADRPNNMARENNRYIGTNYLSIFKFGSIEYRFFRGTTDTDLIDTWAKILLRLKDAAKGYDNPQLIIEQLSSLGPQRFFEMTFGDLVPVFKDSKNVEARIWEGMRLAQDVAYASNWEPDTQIPMNTKSTAKDIYNTGPEVWAVDPQPRRGNRLADVHFPANPVPGPDRERPEPVLARDFEENEENWARYDDIDARLNEEEFVSDEEVIWADEYVRRINERQRELANNHVPNDPPQAENVWQVYNNRRTVEGTEMNEEWFNILVRHRADGGIIPVNDRNWFNAYNAVHMKGQLNA